MAETVLQQDPQAFVKEDILCIFVGIMTLINEDTLFGANTTHCTNGILIQWKVQRDQRLAKTAPSAVQ